MLAGVTELFFSLRMPSCGLSRPRKRRTKQTVFELRWVPYQSRALCAIPNTPAEVESQPANLSVANAALFRVDPLFNQPLCRALISGGTLQDRDAELAARCASVGARVFSSCSSCCWSCYDDLWRAGCHGDCLGSKGMEPSTASQHSL